MTHGALVVALSMSVAGLPQPANPGTAGAPPGDPGARYCLRVDPPTASHMETIQCRTREEWAELGVDVDQEWAQNGVRVVG